MKILLLLIVLQLLAGCGGPVDVEVTAAHEREASEKKADMPPAARLAIFQHPIDCPWVEHCNVQRGCKRRYTCAADLSMRGPM